MRTDRPQTVHLSSPVQALYSPGSIRYPSPSGPSPSPPLATSACHPRPVGQISCLALAFTQSPSALCSTLKRVTDCVSVSSPQVYFLCIPLSSAYTHSGAYASDPRSAEFPRRYLTQSMGSCHHNLTFSSSLCRSPQISMISHVHSHPCIGKASIFFNSVWLFWYDGRMWSHIYAS